MSTEESFVLRLAAIGTWHYGQPEGKAEWKAADAELEHRIHRFREEIERIIGNGFDFKITVNGGCLEALIEDIRFIALEYTSSKNQEDVTIVTLLGRCSYCGVETMSKPFYNLSGLGQTLEKFEPNFRHQMLHGIFKQQI